jgi:hypothetical protein
MTALSKSPYGRMMVLNPHRFRNFSTSEANFTYDKDSYRSSKEFFDLSINLVDTFAHAQWDILLHMDFLECYSPSTRSQLEDVLQKLDGLRFGAGCTGYQNTGFFQVGSTKFLAAPKQPRDAQQIIDEHLSNYVSTEQKASWPEALLNAEKYMLSRGAKTHVVMNVLQQLRTTLIAPDLDCFSINLDPSYVSGGGPVVRIYWGDHGEWIFDSATGDRMFQTD